MDSGKRKRRPRTPRKNTNEQAFSPENKFNPKKRKQDSFDGEKRSFTDKKRAPASPIKIDDLESLKQSGEFKKTSEGAKKKNENLIRLNRYIASTGICSRRQADEFISAGLVSINDVIITEMGVKVKPSDVVKYNGERVRSEKKVYILLNKPKDFVTTLDDPEGRKTVMDLVKDAGKERIYPVGRLDRNTTGVLLLTNDGEIASRLMHPKFNQKKIYHIFLEEPMKPADFKKLAGGVELEDGFIKPDGLSFVNPDSKSELGMEIHSGKNRIVRRMIESLGYKVVKLDRVFFAGLTKRTLSRGQWRFLTQNEINILKMSKVH